MNRSVLFVILCCMILAGCAPTTTESEVTGAPDPLSVVPPISFVPEEMAFPLTVQDATGEAVTLASPPERIVSLAPVNTEIVYALGAGDMLVGRHAYDDYPAEVQRVEVVTSSTSMDVDVERIIDLAPDVVFAHASYIAPMLSQLKEADIPVFVTLEAQSLSQTYELIASLAVLLDRQQEAADLFMEMDADFRALASQAAKITMEERKSVLYEVDSMNLFVAGQDSFITELFMLIGADNATIPLQLASSFPQLSEEDALKLDPDVIVTTSDASLVQNRRSFAGLRAVTEGHVYQIEKVDVLSRTGPRLPEGAKALGQLIYPEVFSH